MTVKKAKCKIVNGLINHISFVAFSLSVLHSSYLVPSPLRWFISQPHFPTWCWSSCSSEEWPSPAPLTASSILSHQSGRSWTMQRYPTPAGLIQPTMCFAPFCVPPVFSFFLFFYLQPLPFVRCGKTQPLRSSSLCRLLGEASSLSPPTISSTITATGKHTKGKPCFWHHRHQWHCICMSGRNVSNKVTQLSVSFVLSHLKRHFCENTVYFHKNPNSCKRNSANKLGTSLLKKNLTAHLWFMIFLFSQIPLWKCFATKNTFNKAPIKYYTDMPHTTALHEYTIKSICWSWQQNNRYVFTVRSTTPPCVKRL